MLNNLTLVWYLRLPVAWALGRQTQYFELLSMGCSSELVYGTSYLSGRVAQKSDYPHRPSNSFPSLVFIAAHVNQPAVCVDHEHDASLPLKPYQLLTKRWGAASDGIWAFFCTAGCHVLLVWGTLCLGWSGRYGLPRSHPSASCSFHRNWNQFYLNTL